MTFHALIDVQPGANGQLKATFNVYDDGQNLYIDEMNAKMLDEEIKALEEALKTSHSHTSEKRIKRQLNEFRKAALKMPHKQPDKNPDTARGKDSEEPFLYDGVFPTDPNSPE